MRNIIASIAGELTPVEIGERIRYRGKHLFVFLREIYKDYNERECVAQRESTCW